MNTEYDVWLGLDVGKIGHHGCGLSPVGERVFDHELPQDEVTLRDVITTLQGEYGRVLVIVDQPNTIGALPVAVARDCGADIAYLPGLAMRKAADLYPGQAKTDATDVAGLLPGQIARNKRCGSQVKIQCIERYS